MLTLRELVALGTVGLGTWGWSMYNLGQNRMVLGLRGIRVMNASPLEII